MIKKSRKNSEYRSQKGNPATGNVDSRRFSSTRFDENRVLHGEIAYILFALVSLLFCPICSSATFSVATYNVENYELATKSEKSKTAVTRTIASAKPDIIGLSEMGSRKSLADLQSRLKVAGLDYPHSEWVDGPDEARHVALLSRFPIVARDSRGHIPFTLGGRAQSVMRGFLDVTVILPSGEHLRLVGAHLKSRRVVPNFDQAQFRAREAVLLRRHIAAAEAPLLLVFGDLNDAKNEPPVREIIGSGKTALVDLRPVDKNKEAWTHYWREADHYSRIDYLLASPQLARRYVRSKTYVAYPADWFTASDHRLLVATFE